MKRKSKIGAYILRCSAVALLFSCVVVALCSAINLPNDFNGQGSALPAAAYANRKVQMLTFADRVAYQRAIEEVYWLHRIWPKGNVGRKPPLERVMSQADIKKKVEDYLRNSQMLEDYWQKPITPDQLQAEMERIASHTKQPEVLHELFAALGNDPLVIAECLARPLLAERFVTELYARDQRFYGELKRAWLVKPETRAPVLVAAMSANYTLPAISGPFGGCTDDTWTPTSTHHAPDGRYSHTAVWTGSEMIVWGGTDDNTGGRYDPSTDSWTPTNTTNAPDARGYHTAVWTGTEMIIWGGSGNGYLNTGSRYNPGTNSWVATSAINAPSARSVHTAVWTGSEMIVWGGAAYPMFFNTGGRYNPNTDSWTGTNAFTAPDARWGHTAVWTGTEMIVWGGSNRLPPSGYLNTGGRYNPSTNSWTATSTINAPSARSGHTAVWNDSEMIVWGGSYGLSGTLNTGGRYNPGTNSWTSTSTTNVPDARSGHTAVWTGSEMIVWGGANSGSYFQTGGRYGSSTDSWIATSTISAPPARVRHTAVWTGNEMIVWGGTNDATAFNTGGRYCAQFGPTSTPTPTATASSTATFTPTATATATATFTPSVTPTATPTATATATPTATPTITPRSTPTPRPCPTPPPRLISQ